jgi:hypothetical protein
VAGIHLINFLFPDDSLSEPDFGRRTYTGSTGAEPIGNSMETPGILFYVASLERRLDRAERWILLHKIGWTLLAGLQAQSQRLRLRELDIVDEKGRERIVLASPLPDPIVNGLTSTTNNEPNRDLV